MNGVDVRPFIHIRIGRKPGDVLINRIVFKSDALRKSITAKMSYTERILKHNIFVNLIIIKFTMWI